MASELAPKRLVWPAVALQVEGLQADDDACGAGGLGGRPWRVERLARAEGLSHRGWLLVGAVA